MLSGTGGCCYVKGHVRLVRVSHLESIFLRDFLFDFVPTVESESLLLVREYGYRVARLPR